MARVALSTFLNRPRLMAGVAAGLATGLILQLTSNALSLSTRAILAWDVGCVVFIAATLRLMARQGPDEMRERAARQDDGRGLILALATAATAASLAAVGIELSAAAHDTGFGRAWRLGLAIVTVALSWFVAHAIYALHYAHEYYGGVEGKPKAVRGGLAFPGDEPPDYWDFLHFALVIGVAAQTADVAFTRKALRRVGTAHSVFAFVFNTVVLALAINLAASLI